MPTQNLQLPFIAPAQAQKYVTHNEALLRLDALVHLKAHSIQQFAPPASPREGECYIVPHSSESLWGGSPFDIATYQNNHWSYISPVEGWRCWISDIEALYIFHNGKWQNLVDVIPLENLSSLGVNAEADTLNRFVVRSQSTLLNHDGLGHRVFVNKANSSETASLVFQTGYQGRGEIGLAGNDDLSFKVSDDGQNYKNAMTIDTHNGYIGIGVHNPSEALDIRSGDVLINNSTPILKLRATSDLQQARIYFGGPQSEVAGLMVFDNADKSFRYYSAGSEKLRLTQSGRLGIGVMNPQAELDVKGVAKLSPMKIINLPEAFEGGIAFVTDDITGPVLTYCDGQVWRRVTDGHIVSNL